MDSMSTNNNDRAKDYMIAPQPNPPPYGPQTTQPIVCAPPPPSSNVSNNTVVVTQPGANMKGAPRSWNTGIFGCCEDCSTTLAVCFCPCIYPCYLADKMGEFIFLPVFVPGCLTALRTKIRVQNNIEVSITYVKNTVERQGCTIRVIVQTKKGDSVHLNRSLSQYGRVEPIIEETHWKHNNL